MLDWLRSLYADWTRTQRPGAELKATRSRNDVTGAEDAEGERETDESADDGSVARADDTPTTEQDLLSEGVVSKRDVRVELGLQPHEFLARLVRSSGGRMWQADIVDTTGWSKSSVSRYLDTLESDDAVERVRIGRRKLVGVPGELPDAVPTVRDPPVDPPADSWPSEVDEPA